MRSIFLGRKQDVQDEEFEESDRQMFLLQLPTSSHSWEDLQALVEARDFEGLTCLLHTHKERAAEIFEASYEAMDFQNSNGFLLRFLVNLAFYGEFADFFPRLAGFDSLLLQYQTYDEDSFDSLLVLVFNAIQDMNGTSFTSADLSVLVQYDRYDSKRVTLSRLLLLHQLLEWHSLPFEPYAQLIERALLFESKTLYYHVLRVFYLYFTAKCREAARYFFTRLPDISELAFSYQITELYKMLIETMSVAVGCTKSKQVNFEVIEHVLLQIVEERPELAAMCVDNVSQFVAENDLHPDPVFMDLSNQIIKNLDKEDVISGIEFVSECLFTLNILDESTIEVVRTVEPENAKIAAELCEFWTTVWERRPELFGEVDDKLIEFVADAEFSDVDHPSVEAFLEACNMYATNDDE